MKLPDLPLSGQARALRTGDVERARRRERDLSTALAGAQQLGSALTRKAVQIAENEARLQATNEITAMQENINTARRDLSNQYLSDDAPPVEQFLEDDAKIVDDAIAASRERLSPRAQRYAETSLAQAGTTGYQESRFKTFSELAANRQRRHLVDVTERAQFQIRQNPDAAKGYLVNGSQLFEDLYWENDQQREVTEREFMTAIVGTTLESYGANGRPEDALAMLNDERYSKYVMDPETARAQATNMTLGLLEQRIDYAIDAVALDPDRGDPLRENMPLTVSVTENIIGFDQDQAVRDMRNRVANVQLQAYINRNRAEDGLARLNAGDFNRDLSGEEIGDWLGKFNTAIAQGAENRVALDLHRTDRLIDGIKNGDPAAAAASTAVIQDLETLGTDPNLSASQRITVREKLFEARVYAENPQLFGDAPTQMSRAELDATIASAEDMLITPAGGDFEDAAMRTAVVNDAKRRLEGLKQEFDSDPAGYLIKYDAGIQANYNKLLEAVGNIDDPEQLEMLPQYMARHIDALTAKQTGEWGVADADVQYFPENMPLAANLVTKLDGMDLNDRMAMAGFLAVAVPAPMRSQFLTHIKADSPATAAAIDYASKGLMANAENQLRGAQRRAGVNASTAKVTKDGEVMEGLRRLGGIPFDTLPAGGEELYQEVLLNEYYAIAPEAEINQGVPKETTLLKARNNTWGAPVDLPFSQFPNNRMMSYRRRDNQVMMPPSAVRAQLTAIRDGRVELEGNPQTLYGGQVTQADLVTKGRFLPVGNGKYHVTLPEAVLVDNERLVDGFVMDETGHPYVLDLNNYPAEFAPIIDPDFGKSL